MGAANRSNKVVLSFFLFFLWLNGRHIEDGLCVCIGMNQLGMVVGTGNDHWQVGMRWAQIDWDGCGCYTRRTLGRSSGT